MREWHRHIYTTMCKLASGKLLYRHWEVSSVPCDDLEADEAWWVGGPRGRDFYIYT